MGAGDAQPVAGGHPRGSLPLRTRRPRRSIPPKVTGELHEAGRQLATLEARRGELERGGVRISIDDFGAGYTSLGQLKTLPIDELKIDKSFVTTMTEDRDNALIVHSVIDLGHNLGLTIVAEGVETTEDALTALRGFSCDVAQGYHLCCPIPATALGTWLSERGNRDQPSSFAPPDWSAPPTVMPATSPA